jgi:hypothetical protein
MRVCRKQAAPLDTMRLDRFLQNIDGYWSPVNPVRRYGTPNPKQGVFCSSLKIHLIGLIWQLNNTAIFEAYKSLIAKRPDHAVMKSQPGFSQNPFGPRSMRQSRAF